MADYYPLIARAVAGLENSTGENRRALYERARTALVGQLRSVEPALSEQDITRERLSLEEAIRKVEAEAARRPAASARAATERLSETPPSDPSKKPAAETGERARPGDVLRNSVRGRAQGPASTAPSIPGERAMPPSPAGALPPSRPSRMPPPLTGPSSQPAQQQPGGRETSRRHEALRPGTPEPGIRGFRDVVADANDLGHASRTARRTLADSQGAGFERRTEPSLNDRGGLAFDDGRGQNYGQAYEYDQTQADERSRPTPPRAPQREAFDGTSRISRGKRKAFPWKKAIGGALAVLALVVLAAVGVALWPTINGLFKSAPGTKIETKGDTAPAQRSKITDRVGQPGTEPVAPVAQRAMIYEEDPSNPQGKQITGSAIWRTETVPAAPGQQADIAIRGDLDFPDRNVKIVLSIRRNADSSLPASHTAELSFTLPPDFAGGGIANVPGILMKSAEQTRGSPLAGLAVKVTDGFFLIGLSNVEADRARNIQALKERGWIDIPIVYANQRRAILVIEKGAPGERVFNEAFAAWGQ